MDDLIVALLSVGGYSLQRTWDRLERLKAEELTNAEAVSALDEAETVRRLARAGYDRGPDVTTSMARRLRAALAAVSDGTFGRAEQLLAAGKPEEAQAILCKVKGIGPTVFKNFLALRTAGKRKGNTSSGAANRSVST